MADATIKEVMAFFGMDAAEFASAWKELSSKDKLDLKRGIGNGSLNY